MHCRFQVRGRRCPFPILHLIDDSPFRLPTVSYLFQALGASVAIPLKTTFFYDLAAASGFISTTIISLFYPSFKLFAKDAWKRGLTDRATLASFHTDLVRSFGDLSTRQVVMGGMIVIWAVRLGFFLFHVRPYCVPVAIPTLHSPSLPDRGKTFIYIHLYRTASLDARRRLSF